MKTNERNIALRSGLTNYPTLKDFMDRRKVIPLPFNESAVVTVTGANVIEIDNTMLIASNLAIGIGTVENGGLFATVLAGAIGTGAISSTSDSLGNILNMIVIRDSVTHDPILEVGNREVFALVQAVSTAVDGDSINASGSENTQLSFVYVDGDGTLTLTSITATVEFGQNNVYLERQLPTIMLESGNPTADVISAGGLSVTQGEYTVTSAYAADEVITLATGAGGITGVTVKTGDTIDIGPDSPTFNGNHLLQVIKNGIEAIKDIDVIWDTSGTFHFTLALDVDDYFEVRLLA